MTMARFEQILDIYGSTPEKWPVDESDAALALAGDSRIARELWDEARRLDQALDVLIAVPPPAALAAQVLMGAPRPRTQRRRRLAFGAAVPLAAAASAVLWLLTAETEPTQVADATPVGIGEYISATDVLLSPLGFDIYSNLPAFGCDASVLGCSDFADVVEPHSQLDGFSPAYS
jgi:hypothetical protein